MAAIEAKRDLPPYMNQYYWNQQDFNILNGIIQRNKYDDKNGYFYIEDSDIPGFFYMIKFTFPNPDFPNFYIYRFNNVNSEKIDFTDSTNTIITKSLNDLLSKED